MRGIVLRKERRRGQGHARPLPHPVIPGPALPVKPRSGNAAGNPWAGAVDDSLTLPKRAHEVEDRIDNLKDFDRSFVIDERTRLVPRKISELLKQSEDRFQKTIVFCVDTEHAARMRLCACHRFRQTIIDLAALGELRAERWSARWVRPVPGLALG